MRENKLRAKARGREGRKKGRKKGRHSSIYSYFSFNVYLNICIMLYYYMRQEHNGMK
jgi:hypothetical protein